MRRCGRCIDPLLAQVPAETSCGCRLLRRLSLSSLTVSGLSLAEGLTGLTSLQVCIPAVANAICWPVPAGMRGR